MPSVPKQGTPLVTVEEVDEWREELRTLQNQQTEIGIKIRDLEARLAAADFFIRERAASKTLTDATALPTGTPPSIKESVPPTMQEAVLRIIRKNPQGLEPRQISNIIRVDPNLPLKIKQSHPNYIYTTLMRLMRRNLIRKVDSRYTPPTESIERP